MSGRFDGTREGQEQDCADDGAHGLAVIPDDAPQNVLQGTGGDVRRSGWVFFGASRGALQKQHAPAVGTTGAL